MTHLLDCVPFCWVTLSFAWSHRNCRQFHSGGQALRVQILILRDVFFVFCVDAESPVIVFMYPRGNNTEIGQIAGFSLGAVAQRRQQRHRGLRVAPVAASAAPRQSVASRHSGHGGRRLGRGGRKAPGEKRGGGGMGGAGGGVDGVVHVAQRT